MKKGILIILFSLLHGTGFCQNYLARLDTLLSSYTGAGKFNGTALVARSGTVLISKGYGVKNAASNTANDVNTIYQLGSVTKQFTAAVILRLQQEHKLSVKDKLAKYFPDFPEGDKITIEHLLTHTSGIYNYTNDSAFMVAEITKPHSEAQIIALFKDKPLDFEPGTKWSYSNSGYVLLGYIIKKVTGRPYEKVVREMIFEPLAMSHSGFDFTHLRSADKATGYMVLSKKDSMVAPIVDSSISYAAGAVYSTVGDLYKWERSIGTNRLLTPASWKLAFTPFKEKYGYGWFIDSLFHRQTMSHGGGIHGFNSHILRLPSEDAVVILLSNVNNPYLEQISKALAGVMLDQPSGSRTAVNVDTAVLRRYTGTYELTPNFNISITLEAGALKAQLTGQQKIDLFAASATRFFYKVVDAEIEFFPDPDGQVARLVLYQYGRELPAKRVAAPKQSPTPKEVKVDSTVLQAYVGTYELAPGYTITISAENGSLKAQATGQPKVDLYAESASRFFLKIVEAQVEFITGPSGKAGSLIWHQGGQDLPGKRIK